MPVIDEETAKKVALGAFNVANEILGTNITTLNLLVGVPDSIFGAHDGEKVHVNKKYFDDFCAYEDIHEHKVKFAFFAGIIAHELRHAYQESLNDKHYQEESIFETEVFYSIKKGLPYDKSKYFNLDIEHDARAFEALIQEKYLECYGCRHLDLPEEIDKDKFETKYNELKELYKDKIDAAFTKYYPKHYPPKDQQ